jgi:4-amino-4-deoxy-L-arabinose transferase-like glycosyltransferase
MENKRKSKLPIIFVLSLACFVYMWGLWNEATNQYYSAGVYSMGQSFHAFFYNSIDSVGFISIDKPPLGLWIQVLFTKVFGFSGLVVLLPQAIAGVLSVYFTYRMINKRFGQTAGIVSALVLTLTPIFAAISRNNTMDGILIVMLVFASDQAIKAAEKSSLKHLLMTGVLLGLGFNVKMLQAYMIVPAVYLTYLVFSKEKFKKRMVSCALSVMLLLMVSFSWVIAVDLTPTENRPYVGSSGTNSALMLAFGYNGIGRLDTGLAMDFGKSTGIFRQGVNLPPPQKGLNPTPDNGAKGNKASMPPKDDPNRPQPQQKSGNGNRGTGEGGTTSIFRLYNAANSGQIAWLLLPAILVSMLCIYQLFKKKLKENNNNITTYYYVMCFIPMFIYFSLLNGMVHRYYLAMLSFVIAPLVGIGFTILMERNKSKNILLPIAFSITAVAQLYIQSQYDNWLSWVLPIAAIIFAASAIAIFLARKKESANKIIFSFTATLLLLPALWSLTPVIYGMNAQLPITGPELVKQRDAFDNQRDFSELISYLKENREGASYLAAAPSSMIGGQLILQSGEPVMCLGGFNGSDTPLTVEEFKSYIKLNKVKYAVVEANSKSSPMGGDKKTIDSWIVENCKVVDRQFEGVALYKLSVE